MVWRRKNEELNPKNLVGTVKYGGGGVLVWGCMSASGLDLCPIFVSIGLKKGVQFAFSLSSIFYDAKKAPTDLGSLKEWPPAKERGYNLAVSQRTLISSFAHCQIVTFTGDLNVSLIFFSTALGTLVRFSAILLIFFSTYVREYTRKFRGDHSGWLSLELTVENGINACPCDTHKMRRTNLSPESTAHLEGGRETRSWCTA
ncbi:hypothetical protein AVEN_171385-1 [Araneus ventricosus]|uniref:Uncharacterized protein n=1 Tax=Araneus ventricosus TaxID=182803 RepID=A0A4Y2FFR0_ARAVE|nr:hypothetical protein AVEN_171385-1 [Araneus ventricosus]